MKAKLVTDNRLRPVLFWRINYKSRSMVVFAFPFESADSAPGSCEDVNGGGEGDCPGASCPQCHGPAENTTSYRMQVIAEDYDVRWPTSADDMDAPYWSDDTDPKAWLTEQLEQAGVLDEVRKECN